MAPTLSVKTTDTLPSFIRHATIILLWLASWWIAALMDYKPYISLWYPPAALSLACFFIIGARALIPIFVASYVITLWMFAFNNSQLPLTTQLYQALLFALAHTVPYLIAGLLFRASLRFVGEQQLTLRIMSFLSLIFISTALAALTGIGVVSLIESMTLTEVLDGWLPWWLGDLAGAMALTPVFMYLIAYLWNRTDSWINLFKGPAVPQALKPYLLKLSLAIALTFLILIVDTLFPASIVSFFIFFVSLPQMWIVYTESVMRSVISINLICLLIVFWFGAFGVGDHAMIYQFALCVIALNSYFGIAVPKLIQTNQALSLKTNTDALTKVASREFFIQRANELLQSRRHLDWPVSLILFDLDEFKDINDTYGHLFGDQALILAAQSIETHIREHDLIARFGGDEFLIILPELNLKEAEQLAKRLQTRLPALPTQNGHIPIKGSFGVVQINTDETLMQALQRADQALMQAKRHGRNQVVCYTSS